MKKEIVGIFVMTLLIITSLQIQAIRTELNVDEENSDIIEYNSVVSDNLKVGIDSSISTEIRLQDSVYEIYEKVHLIVNIIAEWVPSQPEKDICIWPKGTLPEGATFPDCVCDKGMVTGTLDWPTSEGQADTYYIYFSVGETCNNPIGELKLTVIIRPYSYTIEAGEQWEQSITFRLGDTLICLWADPNTLPEDATFTDCHCDYGVTSTFKWTPSADQEGEHELIFLIGDDCDEYDFSFSIEVIVYTSEDITIYQLDYSVNDVMIYDSSFGAVDVTFIGASYVRYFNLVVNDIWVIQNIPLLSFNGVDVEHTVTMTFDLGVSNGVDVTEVYCSSSISDEVKDTPPEPSLLLTVLTWAVYVNSGEDLLPALHKVPKNEVGMEIDGEKWGVVGATMPNQECKKMGCVPTAISNSLQYLKKRFPDELGGLNNNDINIKSMEKAVDYEENKGVSGGTWPDDKDAYMKEKKIPVTTTKIPEGMNNVDSKASDADCEKALAELKKGQDVELRGRIHTAAIVGMAKLKNGKWVIYVAHDTDPGDLPAHQGGMKVEKVMYDPNAANPVGEGAGGFNGRNIRGFVVECPDKSPNKPVGTYDKNTQKMKVKTTDPEEHKIRYGVDWDGDGEVDEWTDYVDSGEEVEIDCTGRTGTVKVIAEDEYGAQSEWTSVKAKNKAVNTIFLSFLDNHPFLYQLLQRFLRL